MPLKCYYIKWPSWLEYRTSPVYRSSQIDRFTHSAVASFTFSPVASFTYCAVDGCEKFWVERWEWVASSFYFFFGHLKFNCLNFNMCSFKFWSKILQIINSRKNELFTINSLRSKWIRLDKIELNCGNNFGLLRNLPWHSYTAPYRNKIIFSFFT